MDDSAVHDPVDDDLEAADLVELSVRQRHRGAFIHDALLFCGAFSIGALVYALARLGASEGEALWTISLSDGLILSGLIAGELLILWNNGYRQGVRGHSVGKHRMGLQVVRLTTDGPAGVPRGLARGVLIVVLLDLAVAAIPIGLPTVLRRLTPDVLHVGGAAYVALVIVLISLFLPLERGLPDRLLGTRVEVATGEGAVTSPPHRRALIVVDLLGVAGVLVVLGLYLAFFWPLIWQFPSLF